MNINVFWISPSLIKHGDSETGLELLEAEVKAHPERLVSQLRLAEAYIALGDPATERRLRLWSELEALRPQFSA